MSGKIYVINTIALGAAKWLMENKREELESYFPHYFMRKAEQMIKEMPSDGQTAELIDMMSGSCSFCEEIGEQGILSALWRMAELLDTGLEVRLRDIPIRQETVEILEKFDLNPYYALSTGAVLCVSDDGQIEETVREAGFSCSPIGELKDRKARTIINGESVRYLDRPQTEELYKLNDSARA